MPRACSICRHENIAGINRNLIHGRPLRDIARQNQVTASSLHRHRTHIDALAEDYRREQAHAARVARDELLTLAWYSSQLVDDADMTGDLFAILRCLQEASTAWMRVVRANDTQARVCWKPSR
jgi:hypothetical protein